MWKAVAALVAVLIAVALTVTACQPDETSAPPGVSVEIDVDRGKTTKKPDRARPTPRGWNGGKRR